MIVVSKILPVHYYLYGNNVIDLKYIDKSFDGYIITSKYILGYPDAFQLAITHPKRGIIKCNTFVITKREASPLLIVGGKDVLKHYLGKYPRVTSDEFPYISRIGLAYPGEARIIDLPRYCLTKRSYFLCGGYLWEDTDATI